MERALTAALASAAAGFRVVRFAVLRDHVHLLVEADDAQRLSRAARGERGPGSQ
jgi:REP element-mobilizing transposase RayT